MSQSSIKRRPDLSEQYNNDWMRELEADANHVMSVLNRLDDLAVKAHNHIVHGDKWGAGNRIEEIREGLRLVGQLMGIKVGTN